MNLPTDKDPIINWHRAHKQKLTTGERAADGVRNGMGSWSFVFVFVFILTIWAILNSVDGMHHWDRYPFILLNLFLSMLAALQGAILLIAAKRADSVSAAMAEHDYETNRAAKREIEALQKLNEQQLLLLQELHKQLETKK